MFEIILGKSVGVFQLGGNIEDYLPEFELDFFPNEEESLSWDCYSYQDGMLDLYTIATGEIETIACSGDCYLNGQFLIGMDIDLFFSIFEIDRNKIVMDTVYFYDDSTQDVYEVDALGLQVWVDNEEQIVTVFVSVLEEEMDERPFAG